MQATQFATDLPQATAGFNAKLLPDPLVALAVIMHLAEFLFGGGAITLATRFSFMHDAFSPIWVIEQPGFVVRVTHIGGKHGFLTEIARPALGWVLLAVPFGIMAATERPRHRWFVTLATGVTHCMCVDQCNGETVCQTDILVLTRVSSHH